MGGLPTRFATADYLIHLGRPLSTLCPALTSLEIKEGLFWVKTISSWCGGYSPNPLG